MEFLQGGGNTKLPSTRLTFYTESEVDLIVLVLSADGKVSGDADMVFYGEGHQQAPGVRWYQDRVELSLLEMRDGAESVVLAATPRQEGITFDSLPHTEVIVSTSEGSFVQMTSNLKNSGLSVLLVADLYARNGEWKLRAKLDGYASGLAGLATDYGIQVDDDPAAQSTATPDATGQEFGPATLTSSVEGGSTTDPIPVVGDRASEPVQVSLKKAERVSLAKLPSDSVVTVDLIWDGGSSKRRKRGADLDLYTLWLDVDGNTGCVAHNDLGSLTQPPYVELVTGDSTVPGIETVKVTRPDRLRKVAFCVYQAFGNGSGSLRSFGAHVVVKDGRGNEVKVPLMEDSEKYWCLVGTVEFRESVPSITQVEAYDKRATEHRPEIYQDGEVRMGEGPDESRSK